MLFYPSVHFGFVDWDDDINIVTNTMIRSLDTQHLSRMFLNPNYSLRFEPLSWLGWALTYRFSQLDPFGYHAGNVLLHSLNTALFCWLLFQLFAIAGNRQVKTGKVAGALCVSLAALLWSTHPLRVEPVAWVTGRRYTQALFFFLLSAIFYLKVVTSPRTDIIFRITFYGSAVVSFALSLLTYPAGIACVGVLFVLNLYPLQRISPGIRGLSGEQARNVYRELAPFFMVSILILFIALFVRYGASGVWAPPQSFVQFGFAQRLMQAFYVWFYYVWRPFYPANLSPVYTTLVDFQPAAWPFLLSGAVVILITAVCFRLRRTVPLLWSLWLTYLILTTPFLGLTEKPHYTSDRYSYFNGLCLPTLAAGGLLWAWTHPSAKKIRTSLLMLAATIIMTFSLMSMTQSLIWKNSLSLFQHMLSVLRDDPYLADIDWRLARAYLKSGNDSDAIRHLDRSIAVQPGALHSRMLRGEYHLMRGNLDQAEKDLEVALALFPNARTHFLYGRLLAARNRPNEALRHFQEAARLDPALEIPGLHSIPVKEALPTNR